MGRVLHATPSIAPLKYAERVTCNSLNSSIKTPSTVTVDESDEITIRRMAELVVDATDFKGPVNFDTSMSDGQHKKTASNAKLRSYLPDYKFTPIEEAIKKTVDWLAENYDKARV